MVEIIFLTTWFVNFSLKSSYFNAQTQWNFLPKQVYIKVNLSLIGLGSNTQNSSNRLKTWFVGQLSDWKKFVWNAVVYISYYSVLIDACRSMYAHKLYTTMQPYDVNWLIVTLYAPSQLHCVFVWKYHYHLMMLWCCMILTTVNGRISLWRHQRVFWRTDSQHFVYESDGVHISRRHIHINCNSVRFAIMSRVPPHHTVNWSRVRMTCFLTFKWPYTNCTFSYGLVVIPVGLYFDPVQ